jgi:hypothetical protein
MAVKEGLVDRVFDLLDDWRHLPDYQLERRADVFFADCLPAFLSWRLKLDIRSSLIPEFPVRIGTIYPTIPGNQSCKVDYLALDAAGRNAVFIELKTDSSSRREKQDEYLQAAKAVGLPALLDGVLKIVCASDHKHKYCCLLRLLEKHALIALPPDLDSALASAQYASAVDACMPRVKIVAQNSSIRVCYLQPYASSPDEIGFEELASWLEEQDGSFYARFANSLRKWAALRPGQSAHPDAGCGL